MIALPILERLDVEDYAMFPGSNPAAPGLHLRFHRGLTLVIGANGLGKTTLVTLLYRMLTGPYDIPALSSRLTLGNADLQPRSLSTTARDQFRNRVADGARTAVAALRIRVGSAKITITRCIRDLSLVAFDCDDSSSDSEERYQKEMVSRIGVGAFSDVILILRHIMFLFEDRRTLVWDPGAQKQLLRLLFLPPNLSLEWTQREREALELDSQARNLRAVIFSQQEQISKDDAASEQVADVRAELGALEEFRNRDLEKRNELLDQLDRADERRKQARLRAAQNDAAHDSQLRKLEYASLRAIVAKFPSSSQSALYLLSQLIADGKCHVCGHEVPSVAAELENRVKEHRCIICNSSLEGPRRRDDAVRLAGVQLEKARQELRKLEEAFGMSRDELRASEAEYTSIEKDIRVIDTIMAKHANRINALMGRLPPDEREMHERQTRLFELRAIERESFDRLARLRREFDSFVRAVGLQITKRSDEIAKSFNRYARDFLVESCSLLWAPQMSPIGQSGERIEFPAFQLELSGADFALPTRRMGPEQVSESQREFIDLAFRMALIEVAGVNKGGSLIVDAPESSLDTVFTERAAAVFSKFARARAGNRLVITSNLVEGTLIRRLIEDAGAEYARERIVNLLEEAEPTGAVQQHLAEYKAAYRRLTRPSRRLSEPGGRRHTKKRKRH